MKGLRFLLWLIVFLALFASFLILFQHGPSGFSESVKMEWADLQKTVGLGK